VNAPKLQSPSPATAVARKATSPASVQTKSPAAEVGGELAAEVDTQAVADTPAVVVKNATNVVKSGILLETALRVVAEATAVGTVAVVGTVAAVVVVVVVVVAAADKPATLVADSATCLATAPKARSATTVSGSPREDSSDADKPGRWRSRSFISRLPFGALQRARLLQMQAARPCAGFLPKLKDSRMFGSILDTHFPRTTGFGHPRMTLHLEKTYTVSPLRAVTIAKDGSIPQIAFLILVPK
jgi:hypothetical protein